jgi:hypothetical protein
MHYKFRYIGSVLWKAWWWLNRVETCCHKNILCNKLLCLTEIYTLYVLPSRLLKHSTPGVLQNAIQNFSSLVTETPRVSYEDQFCELAYCLRQTRSASLQNTAAIASYTSAFNPDHIHRTSCHNPLPLLFDVPYYFEWSKFLVISR